MKFTKSTRGIKMILDGGYMYNIDRKVEGNDDIDIKTENVVAF
jgi:hypothetical protein